MTEEQEDEVTEENEKEKKSGDYESWVAWQWVKPLVPSLSTPFPGIR